METRLNNIPLSCPGASTIMCTLTAGQITDNMPLVVAMHRLGMRSVRINTAHLDGVDRLGDLARRLKSHLPGIGVLIDTKGPEMRTTDTDGPLPVDLAAGQCVDIIGTDSETPTDGGTIYVNYPLIHTELCAGDEIVIDDATIALHVDRVEGSRIVATVTRPGRLGARKGLSVKGKDMALPAVSRRDRRYISYAATSPDIDVVAHSFVRCAADVIAVTEAMGDCRKPIIAKIENRQGIDNLDAIARVSDGLLVARGDLTASIGADAIAEAQQVIADAARAHGLPLYLATNILASMMHSPTPSARDLDGIATAVAQGVNVMLLTNETAAGPYPEACVAALAESIKKHK